MAIMALSSVSPCLQVHTKCVTLLQEGRSFGACLQGESSRTSSTKAQETHYIQGEDKPTNTTIEAEIIMLPLQYLFCQEDLQPIPHLHLQTHCQNHGIYMNTPYVSELLLLGGTNLRGGSVVNYVLNRK